jgi:hypothetical protein
MKKNKLLALFCLTGAIILGLASANFTAAFFMSFDTTYNKYVLLGVAVVVDFCKFALPAVAAHLYAKNKYLPCIFWSVVSLACIIASFAASTAYDLNQSNNISNETVTSSSAYQRQQALFSSTSGTIDSIKGDIAQLKTNRAAAEAKIRADYQPRLDNAKRLKYLTTPKIGVADLSAERDAKISQLDENIRQKEAALLNKQGELSNVNAGFAAVPATIKTTRGINAFAAWLSPTDPEGAIGNINFAKNVLVEVCAITLCMSFGYLASKPDDEIEYSAKPKVNKGIGFQTQAVAAAAKSSPDSGNDNKTNRDYNTLNWGKSSTLSENTKKDESLVSTDFYSPSKEEVFDNKNDTKIAESLVSSDFYSPSKEVNSGIIKEDLKKYIDYMYSSPKYLDFGESPGYNPIGKNTSIGIENARKIKAYLEQLGIIQTFGTKTFVQMEKSECESKISM